MCLASLNPLRTLECSSDFLCSNPVTLQAVSHVVPAVRAQSGFRSPPLGSCDPRGVEGSSGVPAWRRGEPGPAHISSPSGGGRAGAEAVGPQRALD